LAGAAAPASAKKKAKSNIVDLTVDSDDEGGPPDEDVPMRPPPRPPTSSVVIKREQPEAGPSRIKLEPTTPPPTYLAAPTRVKIECEEPTLEGPAQTAARLENPERKQARQASPPHPPRNASFAQDDNVASLEDLLSVLSGSELKTLARDHKLKATGKVAYMVLTFGPAADDRLTQNSDIITALLDSVGKGRDASAEKPKKQLQSTLQFGKDGQFRSLGRQAERLRARVLQLVGPCSPHGLVQRV
jgi:hypothetical protein